jgi:hypothetical protein
LDEVYRWAHAAGIRYLWIVKSLRVVPLALLLATGVLAGSLPKPAAAPVLPFIEDDYEKALSLARQKNVPIFVEAWAPW